MASDPDSDGATLVTDTAALEASAELPDLGPKYRVIRLLGQGGMGAVYEAEHLALRRRVAVKRVLWSGGPAAVERLRREAESASRIGHAGIVEVLDFDVAPDGLPFVVMERLVGETLRDRLEVETRLEPAEALRIVLAVSDALAAAHAAGILHRDVKPENVFLWTSSEGSGVKLLDFGLARVRDDVTMTAEGQVMGTAAYMAPEQVRGERATEKSDAWAVAVTFYECLSGTNPFYAESLEGTMGRVLTQVPSPPTSAGAPETARAFDEVVLRGLEKDAARRWGSVSAQAEALRAVGSGRRAEGMRLAKTRRRLRSRVVRWGAVAVALAAVGVGAGAWIAGGDRATVEVGNVADLGCGTSDTAALRTAIERQLADVEARADVALEIRAECRRADAEWVVNGSLVDPERDRTLARAHARGGLGGCAARVVLDLAHARGWETSPALTVAARAAVPADVEALLERSLKTEGEARLALEREAIAAAPDYVPARVLLAGDLISFSVQRPPGLGRALLEEARGLLDVALREAPNDYQGRLAAARLELFLGRDVESLLRWAELDRVVPGNPHAPMGRARIFWHWGRRREAAAEIADCFVRAEGYGTCVTLRLREDVLDLGPAAIEELLADREREPLLIPLHRITGRLFLGRTSEAELVLEGHRNELDIADAPQVASMMAFAHGDRAGAAQGLARLRALVESPGLLPLTARSAAVQLAEAAAFAGDDETVLVAARLGLDLGFVNASYWEKHWLYEGARRDPRFVEIIAEARKRSDARWAEAVRAGVVR